MTQNTPNQTRNAPCPCKSGKKYKKCCGDNAKLYADRVEAENAEREEIDRRWNALSEEDRTRLTARYEAKRRSNTLVALALIGLVGSVQK